VCLGWRIGERLEKLDFGCGSYGVFPQNNLNLEFWQRFVYPTTHKNCFKTCNCMVIMDIQYITILNLHLRQLWIEY
jgi:hypothetical protein